MWNKIDVITEINLKFFDILEHINWIVELDKYDWYVLKFWWNEYRFWDRDLLMKALRKMEVERAKEKEIF